MYHCLEEIGIFLRLTAKLAGNCALNVIFAYVFVCLGVNKGSVGGCTFLRRESVGLAFLRSCFVSYIILCYYIFVWRVFSLFSFVFLFL